VVALEGVVEILIELQFAQGDFLPVLVGETDDVVFALAEIIADPEREAEAGFGPIWCLSSSASKICSGGIAIPRPLMRLWEP